MICFVVTGKVNKIPNGSQNGTRKKKLIIQSAEIV